MKLIKYFLVLLVLPMVLANDAIFPLADFNDEPIQAVRVVKHDMLSFKMFDQTHYLYVSDLIKDNIKIKFFPNKEEGKSSEATTTLPIKQGKLMVLDVNRDKKKDLSISLYKITNDDAVIVIRDLRPSYEQTETQVPTGMPVGKVEQEENNVHKNSFLILALVVVGLFGVLMLKRKKKEVHIIE